MLGGLVHHVKDIHKDYAQKKFVLMGIYYFNIATLTLWNEKIMRSPSKFFKNQKAQESQTRK